MANKSIMVVGLLFAGEKVLLIQKNRPKDYKGDGRPAWQQGLLNGLGGVVKDGQKPLDRLVEKVKMEAGIETSAKGWTLVNTMYDGDATILVYAMSMAEKKLAAATSPTDETVGLYYSQKLNAYKTVPNIQWLVPMAYTAINAPEQKQVVHTGYNGTDLSAITAPVELFYVVINTADPTRLATVSREAYITKAMVNPLVYAGTLEECGAFCTPYTTESPYPWAIVDGGKDVATGTTETVAKTTSGGASVNSASQSTDKNTPAPDANPTASTPGSQAGDTTGATGAGSGSTPGSADKAK